MNNNKKIKFPGYNAEQERKKTQELDRIQRNQEKARKASKQRKAREEKRANSLPPFLMVRSGLLNQWLWTLIPSATLVGFGIN